MKTENIDHSSNNSSQGIHLGASESSKIHWLTDQFALYMGHESSNSRCDSLRNTQWVSMTEQHNSLLFASSDLHLCSGRPNLPLPIRSVHRHFGCVSL